jgi:hypothetical protein
MGNPLDGNPSLFSAVRLRFYAVFRFVVFCTTMTISTEANQLDSELQLETPLGFVRYFQSGWERSPDKPTWQIGQRTAERWFTYHQNLDASDQTDSLCTLIQQFMPYRFAGSGFYALWMAIVQHLARLSVLQQLPGWLTIFEPANQGIDTIPQSFHAQAVIAYWRNQAEQSTVSDPVRQEFVRLVLPGMSASAYEWIEFVKALDRWFTYMLPNSNFFETVIATYQQQYQT